MADLYDRYGRVTYVLIFRIVRNTGTAEDLVQETFLRVWNRMQAFDSEKGALGPMGIDRSSKPGDRLSAVRRWTHGENAFELEANEHPSLFSNLETEVLNSDRARRLKIAFEKLKPNQRLVIELAYYEGLSAKRNGGPHEAAAGDSENMGARAH